MAAGSPNIGTHMAEAVVQPPKDHLLVAVGKLRRGTLDGLVVINGIVSNDPRSACGHYVTGDGIGFIGEVQVTCPQTFTKTYPV